MDFSESGSSSTEDLSSKWSNGSVDEAESPATSLASDSRRGSDASTEASKKSINSIKDFLDTPMSSLGLELAPSSEYAQGMDEEESILQPDPLQVKKLQEVSMEVTSEVKVEWEEQKNDKGNDGS